jgi:dTDP-4-amino-4,6-dideoxygalactose transaminase
MFKRPISNILSSNIQKDDLHLAISLLFKPKELTNGQILDCYEKTAQDGSFWPKNAYFSPVFTHKHYFSFNAGRSALLAILGCLNLNEGNEIVVQAFTCTAVVSPIIKAGLEPVYCDIDNNLNLDPNDLIEKITLNTKAVIVQHTFGYPAQIEKIAQVCKENNLILIEDCAHCLGNKINNRYLGTFGDIAFYSFGRDKVVSAGFGGMVGVNDDTIAQRLNNYMGEIDFPKKSWTIKQIFHPIIINYFVLPLYDFLALGKIIAKLFLIFNLTAKSVYDIEKKGKWSPSFPKKMPSALKILANNQLEKLAMFQERRKNIVAYYSKNICDGFSPAFGNINDGTYLIRYPLLINDVSKKKKLLNCLNKKGIYLYDGWADSIIVPPDSDINKFKYKQGSCLNAEKLAPQIINLPTHINISLADARDIMQTLKQCK